MPVYAFKGVNAAGKSINGLLDAETSRLARGRLRKDGVYLTELVEQRGASTVKATASRSFHLPSFSRIPRSTSRSPPARPQHC